MKKLRKVLCVGMVVALLASVSGQALAATYDLTEGSISVSADASGQYVTQNSNTTPDNDVVITSNGTETANVISIGSSGGASVDLTLKDVNINAYKQSGIDIAPGSDVTITVEGTNTVQQSGSTDAAIHAADGTLTITGAGEDAKLTAGSGGDGAAIGSNVREEFTGSVTITGGVEVTASSRYEAAGIGAGAFTNFAGTVNITDGAEVDASSRFSAGIGAGTSGSFTGTVNITDGAEVTARGGTYISSVGGAYAAGIGAGASGSFSGTVNIADSAVNAVGGTGGGAAIGSDYDVFTADGQVNIHNSQVSVASVDNVAIGAGDGCGYAGTITITGETVIHADAKEGNGSDFGTLLGTTNADSTGTVNLGPDVQIYNDNVSATAPLTGDALAAAVNAQLCYIGDSIDEPAEAVGANDDFWKVVELTVRSAAAGETVTVNAMGRTAMPAFVLEAVEECGVTLVIQWYGGEDIVVSGAVETEAEFILLSDLAELVK